MANVFDQFDNVKPQGKNVFDQFDAPIATPQQQLQDAFPSSRLDRVTAIQDRVRRGEQSQFGGGLAVLGEGLQQQGEDIVGAVSPYIPDFVKQGFGSAAGAAFNLGTNIGESLPAGGQDFVTNRANEVSSGINYLNKNYPVTMSELKGVANIGNTILTAIPVGGVTAKAIDYTADAANMVKKGANAAAIKTGLAKPAPKIASDFVNPTGLTAIEEINKGYGVAKDAVNNAEKLVRAKAVPTQSANLIDNIDSTINNLADKVAIGSKEQAALSQLSRIRDNLLIKNGLPDTNDLIDIRAAINAGLPVNKFPVAGVGDKLSLKSQVDDLLGNVSKEVPEFGDAYKNYRAAATDIASRFTGNKKLKNFWQPEDYTAYKAFKNGNAELPYNDATLGRANQFLDKLNTQDTGQINAVVKAMPKEVAEAVLRAASKRADSLNPNIIRALGNAAMNLKSGNVAGAVRNVVSDMVTPSKPNLVKDYYNLYKKNPTAPNAKLSKEALQNAFEAKKAAAIAQGVRTEPTITATPRNAVKRLLKDEQGSVPPVKKLPLQKQSTFKTDEGNFSVYDIEKDPNKVRGRASMFTVLESPNGYVVRNSIVPKDLQRNGYATEFYTNLNVESIKKTGRPLRSSPPRTIASTGEVVTELSSDAIKFWDSLVSKGLATKLGDKNYRFK